MIQHYVNEIEVLYKPRLDITPLQKISTSKKTADFLRSIWHDDIEYRERFYAVYLNRQNKILGYHLVSVGSASGTVADTKIIFQPALKLHADSIIIAHNHPSGNINPSNADYKLTKKMFNAGEILTIPILDHIILTIDDYYSFSDNGTLNTNY